jgi:hypothetical protein
MIIGTRWTPWSGRLLRLAGVGVLAIVTATTHAQNAQKVTLTAGTEKVVASSASRFEKVDPPSLGEVEIHSTANGSKHDLVFKAPTRMPEAPIEFSYTITGGQPVKVTVTVDSGVTPEPTSVMVGTELILVADSTTLITKEKAVLGQVVVRSSGDPKKYTLVYLAPKEGAGKKDEVVYVIGDKEFKTSIALQENIWGTGYEAGFKVLFAMFVVAVVLELGLAVLFNWRYFLRWFDAAGAKTVITVAVAYWFVTHLNLDVMAKLVNAVWLSSYSSDFMSRFISALVLAGGSATVNTLMVALGFRSVRTAESIQRKPLPTDAWLAVMVSRADKNVKRADIHLEDVTATNAAAANAAGVAGAAGAAGMAGVAAAPTLLSRLNTLWAPAARRVPLIRNPGRYPGWGGYPIIPGNVYKLKIQGLDGNGKDLTNNVMTVGPFTPARGAIIDIQAVL